jgi:hypothetical protein
MKPLLDWVKPLKHTAVFMVLPTKAFIENPEWQPGGNSGVLFRALMVLGLLLLLAACLPLYAQPAIEWDKTLGGNASEGLNSVQQTRDGGYILGGSSNSTISGDKTEDTQGASDFWVVKLDAAGNKQWDKTIGGNDNDDLDALQQTQDGGYILGGRSSSGISGDKTESRRGDCSVGCLPDFWVVKLDAAGNKQWDKTIGGNGFDDYFISVQQTQDGGYILGGSSDSGIGGDKSEGSRGYTDYWVVKLDAVGKKVWDKTLGGNSFDYLSSLQQTNDGEYILGGWTTSGCSGDKTEAGRGGSDFWVVKLDVSGNKVWDKTLGGSENDDLDALQQTSDRGYILGGFSNSGISGEKSEANRGGLDFWVVKLDAAGTKVWDKTIGGSSSEVLQFLEQTPDRGYILGGYSNSGISGEKTEASQEVDYWVVKLDEVGNKVWDKTIGGSGYDYLNALQQTSDGGYFLGGTSWSDISGDKTEASKGVYDFWVVKLAPFPKGGQVKSFTLLNTETRKPIRLLNNGDILSLADLPTNKLNIRADTHPDAVGSVKFQLRGKLKMTLLDNQAPYALFGDNGGKYNSWTPRPGTYRVRAVPYSQPDGKGTAGTPLIIRFTLVRKPAARAAARLVQASEPAGGQTLYPNPTMDGRLKVQLPGKLQGPLHYSLLSSVGRKLTEGTVNLKDAGNLLEFDFSRQFRNPGLYYLRIEGANVHQVFKIIRR